MVNSEIVAEIEKCYNECLKRTKVIDSDYWNAKADAYRNVLVILNDTLKVKEVDLEREIDNWICDNTITHEECSLLMLLALPNISLNLVLKHRKENEKWQQLNHIQT